MNLVVGSWNVRTLQDSGTGPERRTAVIAKTLSKYKIDIAALSETRLADESQLEEVGSGYTYFWKGKPLEDNRQSGVGFAIKKLHCS